MEKSWYNKLIGRFCKKKVPFSFPDEEGREVELVNELMEEISIEEKQEVFDDLEKNPIYNYGKDLPVLIQSYKELKKRHLSVPKEQ